MNKQKIIMIPSGGTNWSSVADAISEIGFDVSISSDQQEILNADKIILPGVGTASHSMHILEKLDLVPLIKNLKQPVLGICVGMQLLFNHSEEENQSCLGIIPENIVKLPHHLTTPHMGWNELEIHQKNHPLLKDIKSGDFVYFTHSYFSVFHQNITVCYCRYGDIKITAAVNYKNFYGVQFHPERSSKIGLQILSNFIYL